MTADPNLPLLEEAARKLQPFLDEVVFVGGVTFGLLITDDAGAPIRGTNDVDIIAEILTYPDYIVFSERLLRSGFTEDMGGPPHPDRADPDAATPARSLARTASPRAGTDDARLQPAPGSTGPAVSGGAVPAGC